MYRVPHFAPQVSKAAALKVAVRFPQEDWLCLLGIVMGFVFSLSSEANDASVTVTVVLVKVSGASVRVIGA